MIRQPVKCYRSSGGPVGLAGVKTPGYGPPFPDIAAPCPSLADVIYQEETYETVHYLEGHFKEHVWYRRAGCFDNHDYVV